MALERWSREELEDIMRGLVLAILAVPAKRQNDFVRFTWPTENQPGWGREEDVCFVQVTPQQSDIERQRNATWDGKEIHRWFIRVIGVSFLFYGPNAWDNAVALRYGLFSDQTTQTLQKNRLALITDVGSPIRAPELWGAHWWERADLFAQFNEGMTESESFAPLLSTEIQIIPNE